MICPNCKKEIENDSKFCGYCGFKIEKKIATVEEPDVIEEEKNNEKEILKQEKTEKKQPKEININKKVKVLYNSIFMLVISVLTFILAFVSITESDSVYGSTDIVSMIFRINNLLLTTSISDTLGISTIVLGIFGILFTFSMMAVALINLILNTISLIKYKEMKQTKILLFVNMVLAIVGISIIGFNGDLNDTVIVLTILYLIGVLVMEFIEGKEPKSHRIVKGIGVLFIIIAFATIFPGTTYITDDLGYYFSYSGIMPMIYSINDSIVNGHSSFVGVNVMELITYVAMMALVIASVAYTFFFKNKKFIIPILGFAIFFVVILEIIFKNIPSTTIDLTYLAGGVIYCLSSVPLLVVDIIENKEDEQEAN